MILRLDSRLRGNDETQTFSGWNWLFANVSAYIRASEFFIAGKLIFTAQNFFFSAAVCSFLQL
ncbi:hypothetical protein BWD09_06195 [Neisseria dentiae]|uniref:Uncharacterized protein n=1 Tax=Neisseria dentiae TaxID=194197 RepID=A0A1X3DAW0_9NEIS|nr:hypothetical protein BWD09_06195 [Neisseria dentiae]